MRLYVCGQCTNNIIINNRKQIYFACQKPLAKLEIRFERCFFLLLFLLLWQANKCCLILRFVAQNIPPANAQCIYCKYRPGTASHCRKFSHNNTTALCADSLYKYQGTAKFKWLPLKDASSTYIIAMTCRCWYRNLVVQLQKKV